MYQSTKEDFAAYEATQDKFIFCLDLLDLSLRIDGEDKCDRLVEQLEQQFDQHRWEAANRSQRWFLYGQYR